jgi:flagellar hook-associated protein 2
LNKITVSSSDSSIVTAGASSSGVAKAGTYAIEVSQLAQPQRTKSNSLATGFVTTALTTLSLTRSGASLGTGIEIPVGATPAQIVSIINASPVAASSGVKASLINTGTENPHTIVLEGASGAAQGFSVSYSGNDLGFGVAANTVSEAKSAKLKINNVSIERPTNTVSDAVTGLSFQLRSAAVGREIVVSTATDTTSIVENVKNFVEAYNLVSEFLVKATGPKAEDDDIAGSLQADSNARSIRTKLRETLTRKSTSASGTITHWGSLGVSLDRNGVLQFDESKFTKTFAANAEDSIQALSNNASTPFIFSGAPSGLAGDIAVASYGMIRSTGIVSSMTRAFDEKLSRVERKQSELDSYVERMTAQYEKQFSALNSVLAAFKDTQTQLERSLNLNNNN